MNAQAKTAVTSPTIALFGLFGCNNLGNEATLAATLHALRQRLPDVHLVLVSDPPPPEAAIPAPPRHLVHDPLPVAQWVARVRPYRFQAWVRPLAVLLSEPFRAHIAKSQARGIDQLLIAGTGIADDFYQGPFDVPIDLLRWCQAVRRVGGKVRFLSVGAGPVSHWLSVRWFRQALRAADYRSYREVSSHRFALQVGIDAKDDPVLPDMVFSLPVADYLARRPLQWPPQVIGLGVMAYRGWNVDDASGEQIYATYLDKLTRLARTLLSKGYHLRLLTGARGSDPATVTDLLATLSADECTRVTANPIQSYQDVLAEIAATDLVIATRFHNVLKALLLERPVISIEYGHKNTDLMRDMGWLDYCHTVETFDPDAVLAQVDQLAALPEAPVAGIRARVAEYRQQLERQYDRIVQVKQHNDKREAS